MLGFLLLSFPLGIVYGLTVFTGLALSATTLIVGVGFLLFERTCAVIHVFASQERQRIAHVLGISLPVQESLSSAQTWRQRLRDAVCNPLTWKQGLYLLLTFPLGVVSFGLTLVLLVGSIGFTLMPLFYLVGTYFAGMLLPESVIALSPEGYLSITGSFESTMFGRSLLVMSFGLLCCGLTLLVIKGLAALWGALARGLLSSGVGKQLAHKEYDSLQLKSVIR